MAKVSHRKPVAKAAACFFPNVIFRRGDVHDHYVGDAKALVDAGLVTLDQLPDRLGRGRKIASFNADGTPRVKGCSTKGWLEEGAKVVAVLKAGRYRVDWVVAEEERKRRLDELGERCEQDYAAHSMRAAIKVASESSRDAAGANVSNKRRATRPERTRPPQTTFSVGDRCIHTLEGEGVKVVVARGYGTYLTQSEDGEGVRRAGYLVRIEGDDVACFAAAGELLDLANGIRHMAVVR